MSIVSHAMDAILNKVFAQIEAREFDKRIMPYTALKAKNMIMQALEVRAPSLIRTSTRDRAYHHRCLTCIIADYLIFFIYFLSWDSSTAILVKETRTLIQPGMPIQVRLV
jgi:hypothetical protein